MKKYNVTVNGTAYEITLEAVDAADVKTATNAAPAIAPAASAQPIENRQEIIAAVSAALAEEMGTDISAIRIHSFKKI